MAFANFEWRHAFQATITWSDGSTSTGTITAASGGGFQVSGTHTFAASLGNNGVLGAESIEVRPEEHIEGQPNPQ
jgi:hypothetical protein